MKGCGVLMDLAQAGMLLGFAELGLHWDGIWRLRSLVGERGKGGTRASAAACFSTCLFVRVKGVTENSLRKRILVYKNTTQLVRQPKGLCEGILMNEHGAEGVVGLWAAIASAICLCLFFFQDNF